jgi:hypothetical protein
MTLLEALIAKGYPREEANDIIVEMRSRVEDGEDPEEILFDEGLEPDYVFDLLMDGI